MNYTSRYNLDFNPFIKNSKEILVETPEYKEIKYRLDYLLQTKGFGLITGDPGMGKTTSIRNWAKTLNPSAYKVIYLPLSTLTVLEAYRQIAASLNIEPKFRKVDNFKEIQSAIKRLAIDKKITPIIIFDEANYMPTQMLNDLKILFNFDMDSKDYAAVILAGLPVLISSLNLKSNEPLKQRIVTSYNLEALNQEDSAAYIKGKLNGAGSTTEVFSPSALKAITSYSKGNPRIISKICNTALLVGDKLGVNTIDEEVILHVINEVEL
ncbi:MAG: AAA family ATPase [Erysipelotrichaceae bacterium]|nr:AAA family ATPase [Erysipelotrichaceae bacterium]